MRASSSAKYCPMQLRGPAVKGMNCTTITRSAGLQVMGAWQVSMKVGQLLLSTERKPGKERPCMAETAGS